MKLGKELLGLQLADIHECLPYTPSHRVCLYKDLMRFSEAKLKYLGPLGKDLPKLS